MKLNILTIIPVVVAIGLFLAFNHQPWTPARIAGVTILLPSLALLVLARIELGSSLAIQAKANKLVTHGLYSRIRNPIYVFGGLAIAGFFLFWDPRFLLIFLILVPMQIYRARQEEKVLAEKFGEEYIRYKQRTWF
jgi:protein-S-isoprenylcysteine O-methyltransferase Ste14